MGVRTPSQREGTHDAAPIAPQPAALSADGNKADDPWRSFGGKVQLEFSQVSYGYRRRSPVLESFDWQVPSGRTVLLGPNGAGKSTLFGIAVGLLRPWSGHVRCGSSQGSPSRRELARRLGWMPQSVHAFPGLSCFEQVSYCGWLKGLTSRNAASRARQVIAQVGLEEKTHERASSLSGGQLRRLVLAQTLVARPLTVLLDEPTVGLDPAQRARFREVMRDVSEDTEVLVSTHMVDDLVDHYDTVVVIAGGRLQWQGSPTEFTALTPTGSAEAAYLTLVDGRH